MATRAMTLQAEGLEIVGWMITGPEKTPATTSNTSNTGKPEELGALVFTSEHATIFDTEEEAMQWIAVDNDRRDREGIPSLEDAVDVRVVPLVRGVWNHDPERECLGGEAEG